MLEDLLTSKTRARLLLKLFLNPEVRSYLREIASELNVSPAAVKGELDHLSEAGYLEKEKKGRSVLFRANTKHPFYPELHSIARKHLGIDRILDHLMTMLAPIDSVYLLDDYALGKDSGLIDILIVGDPDRAKLEDVRARMESKIARQLRVHVVNAHIFSQQHDLYLSRPHYRLS